jgi:hypothetical protein
MMTEEEIRRLLDQVKFDLDSELNTSTEDPIIQWTSLKIHQAEKNILEQVLE